MSKQTSKASFGCFGALLAVFVLLILSGAFYTISESQQAVITQFGKPVGTPITEAGLRFKIPFIQEVNRIDKRILAWDGKANEMPTKDKTYILVDTFGRWSISEPLKYFERLRDERSAQSRLDDILGSETRAVIAKHELIEVVRTTKDRQPLVAESLIEGDMAGQIGVFKPIKSGRSVMEAEILKQAKPKLLDFGIELLDVRFKRINYSRSVEESIFQRMISERQQIAERFRSEGAGEAAKIMGSMEKDLREIESTAYRKIETLKGEADAKATAIYAAAYNQNQAAADFYDFTRTLEVYETVLDTRSTVILSTDSELFQLLKTSNKELSE